MNDAGGELTAENVRGGGVRFTIRLPLAKHGVKEMTANDSPLPTLDGRRILVVDDEESVRNILGWIMEKKSKALVAECASGEQALRQIHEEEFDAVILDLRMPVLSGQEVFRRLPDQVKRRVVFITGDVFNSSTREFIESVKQPILFKPVNFDELIRTVGNLCD